jgi:hypothetical protein
MKIKHDFITNSSSASFYLRFEATQEDMSKEEFIDKINQYLKYNQEEIEDLRFWDASSIREVCPNVFEIIDWTSMFNGQEDIPTYMKHMIISSFLEEFDRFNLKFVNFRVNEDD